MKESGQDTNWQETDFPKYEKRNKQEKQIFQTVFYTETAKKNSRSYTPEERRNRGEKRRIIILVAGGPLAVWILRALVDAHEKKSVTGSWTARKIQLEGMSEPQRIEDAAKNFKNLTEKERQEAIKELKNYQVTFRENGTMEVSFYDSMLLGTWTEIEDGVYLAVGGEGPHIMTFTLNKRDLTMEDDTDDTIIILEEKDRWEETNFPKQNLY